MATVRIYKVAELLGVASQEVLALLKSDHGIELKSASSTLEEVVARSFVERVARQRNIDGWVARKRPGTGTADAAAAAGASGPAPTEPSEATAHDQDQAGTRHTATEPEGGQA